MVIKLDLKQIFRKFHYFFQVGGWLVGWCGRIENKAKILTKLKLKLKLSATTGEKFKNRRPNLTDRKTLSSQHNLLQSIIKL